MEIWQLPKELQEKVLSLLDGHSIGRAQQVCKLWYSLVQNLQKSGIWKDCCLRESSLNVMRELIGNCDPPNHSVNDCCSGMAFPIIVNWKKIYQRWFSGRVIGHWTHWLQNFPSVITKPITCVKFSGSQVITGHMNGSVCSWDSFTGNVTSVVSQHLRTITDIALIDLLKEGPYCCGKTVLQHHHAISVSQDHRIHICPLLKDSSTDSHPSTVILHQHSDTLETIKVYGRNFIVKCRDDSISIWHLECPKLPTSILKATLCHILVLASGLYRTKWIGFWQQTIYCFGGNGVLQTVFLDSRHQAPNSKHTHLIFGQQEVVLSEIMVSECSEEESVDLCLLSAFIFREGIAFLMTVSRRMYITINGQHFRQYQPIRDLGDYVVSVSLHGTLLGLGTESGRLLLFYLSSPNCLLDLDLAHPTWSTTLSEASIVALDVTNGDRGPVVVAATTASVYIIRWFSLYHLRLNTMPTASLE